MITNLVVDAAITLTSPSGAAPVAGQTSVLTINFNPVGNVQQDWPTSFVYGPVTASSVYAGGIYFLNKAPIANTCTGLAVTTPARYAVYITAAASPQMATIPPGGCAVSFNVVPGSATTYDLNATADAAWFPDANSSGQALQIGTSPAGRPTPVPVSTPADHIYVPVDTVANQGSVQVYTEGPSPKLTCTISYPADISNPVDVAVNPYLGNIYVLDKTGVVAEFGRLANGCPSTPVASWNTLPGANLIAVDQSDLLVVSGCNQVGTYNAQGTEIASAYIGAAAGEPSPSCLNSTSTAYFDGGIYAVDTANDVVLGGNVLANGTVDYSARNLAVYGDGLGGDPKRWNVAAISGRFYFDLYDSCTGTCPKVSWTSGQVQTYFFNTGTPFGGIVGSTGGFIDSGAYDLATGNIVYSNGSEGSTGNVWPKFYTPYIYENNMWTNATTDIYNNAIDTQFPTSGQLFGIAVGP